MEMNIKQEERLGGNWMERAYTMHFQYPFKMKALFLMMTFLTIGFGYFLINTGDSVAWYIKAGIGFIYAFFMLKRYYDVKYYMGVKKNLFLIDEKNDEYSYFNEFEGLKKFKLSTMSRIKIFRNKNGVHLIEIKTNDGAREQNINVSCLSQQDIMDMVQTLRSLYPEVEFAENLPPYEVAKAQKEAERQAKKEKYKKK